MEGVFAGVGDLGRQGKQVGLDALGAQACQERSVLSEDDDGSVAGGIEGVEQVKQSDLAAAQARRVIHIQDRTRGRFTRPIFRKRQRILAASLRGTHAPRAPSSVKGGFHELLIPSAWAVSAEWENYTILHQHTMRLPSS